MTPGRSGRERLDASGICPPKEGTVVMDIRPTLTAGGSLARAVLVIGAVQSGVPGQLSIADMTVRDQSTMANL
jgi:hypothetical protein